jgi:PAS domain S-box-containing protein|nr:PAS domain-containing protein [uncultured Methanoregula sp.]
MTQTSVLIVEDDAVAAGSLNQSLTGRGYTVAGIIPDGETALVRIGDLQPDLVLMDMELAGRMTGIETAENIRLHHHLPVIYLIPRSGHYLDRARESLPFWYIVKPVREQELIAAIGMALYRHRCDETIRLREEALRTMVNALPDAIVVVDRNRRIIAANERGEGILGAPGDILAGCTSADLHRLAGAAVSRDVDRAFRSGHPVENVVQAGKRWFETSIHPVKDPVDRTSRVVVRYRDISSKRARVEDIQEDVRRQVESNIQEFENFSDRIRNPLQVIKGYAFLGFFPFRWLILRQLNTIDAVLERLDSRSAETDILMERVHREFKTNNSQGMADIRDNTGE